MPNHRILERNLLKRFYKALNANTKAISDTIFGGDFMSLHWELAIKILVHVSKTNWGMSTYKVVRGANSYAISFYGELRALDNTVF